ncbi:hypothetical protein C3F09_08920 [candidate division GN15 bacterium]|uniref:FlgD/Vpr Ig-like domain-containing protein n=1 Tax=candidate division GN15 bacterium TaxID=2072418 RepID=A0A855X403_9BACT|nr:MAG: hypothetical protein C3F09_08920 [candidate division GN15 bacterium]
MRVLPHVILAVSVCGASVFSPSVQAVDAVSMEYVGSTLWSGVNDVAGQGNYLYAACQYGLQIIDISNTAQPTLVSQLYLPPGGFIGIAVQGGLSYLAANAAGVAIIDVSDPANPHLLSWCDTPGSASAVAVNGSYLYVTDAWAGLHVVDVADPEHPVIKGSYDTPGDARDIALFGEYVLVADGYDGGLQVINVALPELPYPAGGYDTDGIARGVTVEGNLAYVADADGGVVILDLTDPTGPVRLSTFPASTFLRNAGDVAVYESVVYYVGGYLKVVDASDPDNPQAPDTLEGLGYFTRVSVFGDQLIALEPTRGVSILDLRNPLAPLLLGQYRMAGAVTQIAAIGNTLAVGDDPNGMHLLDATNPSRPEEIGFVPALMQCLGVAGHGNYAYFVDADSGTHIIDISDASHPSEVGRFWSTGRDLEITSNSGFLSVSGYPDGNSFYSLVDPANPSKIGSYNASYAGRAACDGRRGYIAAHFYGFQIANLVDSQAAFLEWKLPTTGWIADVVLDSQWLYLAHEASGLFIVDISDPSNPEVIGGYGLGGLPGSKHALGIARADNLAFLALDADGVWAIDVADPSKPQLVAAYNTLGNASRVAVSGDYVYVADEYGVVVVRVNHPTDVLDESPDGLPNGLQLAQNYPNPFNPRTNIEFSLARKSHVLLAIYNILGEEVAELINGDLTAGTHRVGWDGRDARGNAVASGVYLYRLSVEGKTMAKKMLLLK